MPALASGPAPILGAARSRAAAHACAATCAMAACLAAAAAYADTSIPPPAVPSDATWALAPLAGASGASSAAKDAKKKYGVKMQGQAGLVLARGNTDTTTANAKFELTRTTRATDDDFEIEGLYGKTGSVVTAERWATNLQRDWNLGAETFWFADGHYEHDLFSGFAYQGNVATGAGYKFIDTGSTLLEAQVGAGYRRLRPEELIENSLGEVTGRIAGNSQGELVGTGKLDFSHSFNSQTKITETVMTVAGSSNTYLESDLALNVKLNGSLSLSLGYTVRNNSNPPPGLLHTDTLTTVNLVYQADHTK